MKDPIRALVLWVRLVLVTSAGNRHLTRTIAFRPAIQPPDQARPRTPRPPYGLDEPLDADETAMVRPYLLAHERQARQLQRRLALVLAADFDINLDTLGVA
ncbi:hypothetical protein [Streptomyces vilmorinianum]|uniref:hypothetical protein n=1 Tax=Streptomyces vilmorinianum TaxID=3051092 RepID=UPI0010FB95EC|nr:hypothetical protein [Streptomyces vilmorinianum]